VIRGPTLVAQGTALIIHAVAEADAGTRIAATKLMDSELSGNGLKGGRGVQWLTINGAHIKDPNQILGASMQQATTMLLKEQLRESVANSVRMIARGQGFISTTIVLSREYHLMPQALKTSRQASNPAEQEEPIREVPAKQAEVT
jgi:hypothetical protein